MLKITGLETPSLLVKKRVILALGSNIEPRKKYLKKAIDALRNSYYFKILSVTPVLENPALLYTEQPDFLNQLVELETYLPPFELLRFVKKLEWQLGRKKRFRYGPREIDIDIIFYEDRKYTSPILTVPHPGIYDRPYLQYLLGFLDTSGYGYPG